MNGYPDDQPWIGEECAHVFTYRALTGRIHCADCFVDLTIRGYE